MHNIKVTISNARLHDIESEWRTLYENAHTNFFLSWDWIGVWLEKHQSKTYLCQAKVGDMIVGLALITENKYYKYGLVPVTQMLLHKTGDEIEDQPWIEYNDFLLHSDYEKPARLKILDAIYDQLHWDEFVVGASTHKALAAFELKDLSRNDIWVNQSYQADLRSIRDRGITYLDTLSKNTRYQINRSLRSYQKMGKLSLEFASDKHQAKQWFDDAGPLHIQRWQQTNVGSGYVNKFFVSFHHDIIINGFERGTIDVIKISVADTIICYLYNFIDKKEVKFYLAATNFNHSDKNLKPGLVAHYLAIQEYVNRGFDTYDFMAGDSQYKRSLSSSSMQVCLASFKRNNAYTRIESRLRQVKHAIGYRAKLKNTMDQKSNIVVTFYLTGGKESAKDSERVYDTAKLLKCTLQDNELTVVNELSYQTPSKQIHHKTNITFKAGSTAEDKLYVVTETEVLIIHPDSLEILETITDTSFNDLHHVLPNKDVIHVANTGLDCVTTIDTISNTLTHKNTAFGQSSRLDKDIDYRLLNTTKPHFVHPNHLFFVGSELWVTRCDTMDAVCLSAPSKRIPIGSNLVHDGSVFKNKIYFTTVDGNIKVYNANTLVLTHQTNLHDFIPDINGWCRGIMPVSSNLVIVGISKYRQSKRNLPTMPASYARILMIDIFKQKVLFDKNVSALGIDAIFSVLPSNQQ